MNTLRVLLPGAPQAGRADAWAVFGLDGRVLQEGRGTPAEWPRTDRVEAVLAAERSRLVDLTLPPLSADRVPGAVAYARAARSARSVFARPAPSPRSAAVLRSPWLWTAAAGLVAAGAVAVGVAVASAASETGTFQPGSLTVR